jgi:hypothetical protein
MLDAFSLLQDLVSAVETHPDRLAVSQSFEIPVDFFPCTQVILTLCIQPVRETMKSFKYLAISVKSSTNTQSVPEKRGERRPLEGLVENLIRPSVSSRVCCSAVRSLSTTCILMSAQSRPWKSFSESPMYTSLLARFGESRSSRRGNMTMNFSLEVQMPFSAGFG